MFNLVDKLHSKMKIIKNYYYPKEKETLKTKTNIYKTNQNLINFKKQAINKNKKLSYYKDIDKR